MHSNDYEIIKYNPEFKMEVIELLSPMWRSDMALNTAYFEWKHCQNPYVEEPIFYLCLYEGSLVGVRAYFGARWQLDQPGQYVNCLADADAIIHPDHRRRGLLTKMTTAALEDLRASGFEYIITLSANRYSSAANRKMGWRNVGYFDTAYRRESKERGTEKSQSGVRNLLRKVPYVPGMYRRMRRYINNKPAPSSRQLPSFNNLDKNFTLKGQQNLEHITIEKAPRSDAMADLIRRIGDHNRIQHVRDQEFFSWRYQNPLSSYRFLFWVDRQLEGYLVLQSPALKPGIVTIVDWEASNQHVRAGLLKCVVELGSFNQLFIWSMSLSDTTKKLLYESGFEFKDPSGDEDMDADLPHVLIRPVKEGEKQDDFMYGENNLQDLSNWDLRAIYADGF